MLNDDNHFLIPLKNEEENYNFSLSLKNKNNQTNIENLTKNNLKNKNSITPISNTINKITDINYNNNYIHQFPNYIFDENKSYHKIVNELIEENNFKYFKIFFLNNKHIFLKSFFINIDFKNNNTNNSNDNYENNKPEFNYLLHVLVNLNMYEFVEFILKECKNYLSNLDLELNDNNNYKDNNINNYDKEKENNFFNPYLNNYKYINHLNQFINSKDNYEYIPLHYAVTTGNLKLINLLIENKADVNILTKNGFNCLHLASKLNKLEVFIFLFEKNKDKLSLNDLDNEGNSILHVSCFSGAFDIFEFLISEGLNVSIRDFKGNTPLHYAVFNGN
jgi:ankyrin repeat protein